MTSLQKRLRQLHSEQGGAVALMALAAILILFMTAMMLYDTGNWTRDKIQNQAAADTAAYSQAAVKARTMNMIAYTNVAKRSIAAIFGTYMGATASFLAWWAGRCSKCRPWNPGACWDCAWNADVAIGESGIPYVAPRDYFKMFPSWLGGRNGHDKYKNELEELTKYQEYITTLTPWWAYLEGSVRGTRNGSTVVSSFPPPPNLALTSMPDWANSISQFLRGSPLYNQTSHKDEMPVEKGRGICRSVGAIDNLLDSKLRDPVYIGEGLMNGLLHRQRSQKRAADARHAAVGVATAAESCLTYFNSILALITRRDDYGPFQLTDDADGDRGQHLWRKSNIVYAYTNRGENMSSDRTKFNLIPTQDFQAGMLKQENGGGFWTLARGEFVSQGGHNDPWHTSWTGRLRPVALPDEFQQAGFNLNATYHDIIPFLALQSVLGLISGLDASSALSDFVAMEKASRAMGNTAHQGMFK